MRSWLAPLAIGGLVLGVAVLAGVLMAAGDTLGYDYRAYEGAARRLLEGRPLYDPAVDVAGGFAIYLYPPPFVLLAVPFALLPEPAGVWTWIAGLLAAFVAGCRLMPVRSAVRWATLVLGLLMWPLVYAVKLGQVGPLLFLLFAIGWRSIERPVPLGGSIAAATIVKVQPALLVGWAAATRRWRAAGIAVGVLVIAALVVTPLVGVGAWSDYVALLGRVSAPITTPHNFTPGAVLFQLGVPQSFALAAQWAAMAGTLALTVFAWFRAPAAASYLGTVLASQLLSPLLWDHYAMLLLLPVAYLLDRGMRWPVLVPLAMSVPLLWLVPAWAYPLAFGVLLLATVGVPTTVFGRTSTQPFPA